MTKQVVWGGIYVLPLYFYGAAEYEKNIFVGFACPAFACGLRSEERRVGKECGS